MVVVGKVRIPMIVKFAQSERLANWTVYHATGFSPDPVLSGIAVGETIKGIQAAGVMATTKHYILNEQEHFRQGAPPASLGLNAISSNVDDVTMHELYLWPFADAVRAGTGSIMYGIPLLTILNQY